MKMKKGALTDENEKKIINTISAIHNTKIQIIIERAKFLQKRFETPN